MNIILLVFIVLIAVIVIGLLIAGIIAYLEIENDKETSRRIKQTYEDDEIIHPDDYDDGK